MWKRRLILEKQLLKVDVVESSVSNLGENAEDADENESNMEEKF